jgi:hypothetical protein
VLGSFNFPGLFTHGSLCEYWDVETNSISRYSILFVQPIPIQQERDYFLKRYTLEFQLFFRFIEVGCALSVLAAGQCIERYIYLASCRIGIEVITRMAQTPRASIFSGSEFEPVIPELSCPRQRHCRNFLTLTHSSVTFFFKELLYGRGLEHST